MQCEELRINVSGYTLAAKQWGDATKPALLALHGWLDNAATYDLIAPHLADYRVIALDFAGHGYSEHLPEGMRYHMLDNVDDVVGVADTLGLESFVLMGHSMGAGISSLLAGAFPERIQKLVLIEGIGTHTTTADRAAEVLRKAVLDMKKEGITQKPVYSSVADAIAARMQALGGISEEASTTLCSRGLTETEGGYTWRSDPRVKMNSAIRLTDDMIDSYLKNLTMPVLLISG
ncbi:MAG: alpha/beta hydrolase, partial [Pseudomonadales bacterium]|nr:alpha/beta hydrolase [Pseudomonadales bacterium]